MNEPFYRAQAALCRRIARNSFEGRIADELMRMMAEFEAKAAELQGFAGDAELTADPRRQRPA
jgi:hypothetical protein